MIGTVLAERYEIIEEVGVGGMAVVYKADDLLLRRQVAVKVLKEQFSEDPEFSDKFEIEAQSAASLSHPNIVSIYDVGSEKIKNRNVQYIVMELINGETLKDIIVRVGQLSNEDTVDYSIQIAEALKAAHNNNIIHRDIKPQNIMITTDGMAKVTDFGIARISTSATITYTSSILGTVHYISPEQAKGKFIDHKSDLYSLGIVMYEMVTGRVPFDAENSVGIALKHIQDEVVPPKKLNSQLSDKLNDIILKCLRKNPDDRFEDASELIEALKSYDILLVTDQHNTEPYVPVQEDNVSVYATNNRRAKEEQEENNTFRNALIAIILAVICVSAGFFIFTGIRDNVAVEEVATPELIGLSEEEAVSSLEREGLNYNIVRKANKDIEEGIVFDQDPARGTRIAENSNVELTVSDGLEEKTMPKLIGMDIEEAKSYLANEGMVIASEKYEDSDEEPGTIISQSPASGDTINSQSQISVVVSHGETKDLVIMPSLLGSSQSAAVSNISDSGLLVGEIDRMASNEYPEGTVMWQSYDAGTSLEPETKVDFIISTGSNKEEKLKLPEGTIDLTGGDYDSDVKIYTFTIQPPRDRDQFNLKVVRNSEPGEETVYNNDHGTSESFDLNFLDYTSSRLDIYYDDELVASTTPPSSTGN